MTRSTWKAIAFSPGLELRLDGLTAPAAKPAFSWVICSPAAMGTSAGVPVSSDGSRNARLLDGLRRHLASLGHIRRHRIADGDVVDGHDDGDGRWSSSTAVARALVQQDDDSNEGQDGEQHPNQDDQTIGSLHGEFLTRRMKIGAQMSREDMQAL